ncbi:glutamine-hydrolyzing carbamoyl-phosphate synthase small subunit [Saccharolobus caldissimus]|uniref:Carbamoyl phosphate synthase small chain n=1 Tax=Saccharolobus caldissimus TaxID=1702097 RepID=A0AAQ4CNE1_9CREN|nr:glutamine-hydrolyzing carbamoyl-phosphate synthase small subunit [Saccharolobus caldissimus]BDB97322.1 carbamoyl phosphate synthase small subunit [Saccharolobus caldissimus]
MELKSEKGYLYLEDGTLIEGYGFGAKGIRVGEIVFTTAMNGYVESLTDPSYKGQILIITHPLVGNYGIPKKEYQQGILTNFESERIQVEGLVVTEHTEPIKWNSTMSLDEWLKSENIPGVFGVDTRMLVKKIRTFGTMMGIIASKQEIDNPRKYLEKKYDEIDFTKFTSPKSPIFHPNNGELIVVIDCGIKHGILYALYQRGFSIVRVPCDYTADEIIQFDPKGIVFSNGPGNPNLLSAQIKTFSELIEYKIPILGICLGHQIATLALGGKIRKMKFGHRAINKPVIEVSSGKCYITTHNHGYGIIDRSDIPPNTKVWFYNPDDGTIEGLIHEKLPIITTQFHPEARPGPWDVTWVFDKFKNMVIRK